MKGVFFWNVAPCSLVYYCNEVSETPAASVIKTRCWWDQTLPLVHINWSRTCDITESAKIRTHNFYRFWGHECHGPYMATEFLNARCRSVYFILELYSHYSVLCLCCCTFWCILQFQSNSEVMGPSEYFCASDCTNWISYYYYDNSKIWGKSSKVLHSEPRFVCCWNLDTSESRPENFKLLCWRRLEKIQLDRSCEKWRRGSITQGQG